VKRDRLRVDGTGVVNQLSQAEAREGGLAAAADEFAADTVARIMACLKDRHGDVQTAQCNAQRETRQTAANNLNGFGR